MLRAMDSAVAGLRAHQNKLDVIGNNIANVHLPDQSQRIIPPVPRLMSAVLMPILTAPDFSLPVLPIKS